MSIDFYEPTPSFESHQGLDISIEKSKTEKVWDLSFATDDAKQREAYQEAVGTTMKLETFHAERISKEGDIEQKWEITGVPEDTEPEDFSRVISDIQSRADSILKQPLAA